MGVRKCCQGVCLRLALVVSASVSSCVALSVLKSGSGMGALLISRRHSSPNLAMNHNIYELCLPSERDILAANCSH